MNKQNKKAIHESVDDLIKLISAFEINSGQIECDSAHLPKQS